MLKGVVRDQLQSDRRVKELLSETGSPADGVVGKALFGKGDSPLVGSAL